ncbi:dynein light intermediate chain [Aspergillus sclerotioniger CBS 115572]|uniref:Dynein light intermediate chain n=1 Tax=Aspergillus sclerotioniger CBS 115572 TaxID=1450535 RepID=A0A317XDA0_9EURO|nr:dynein light intermediate chain [Aspergillus sclerotioniger CBS 115572]PWY96509.1 dynein light intermediate chain [Aspergillus sclerotioniger CBS 115572]
MSASNQIPGSRFGTGNNSRPSSKDGPKKNIWSSMLDSVANGKRLPEKNLLILGGTPESQREFLDTLAADSSDPSLSNEKRKGRVPPVANQFALGYTYQDVLDADHEDTLARVSAYLLSEPSLSFAPLLKPLLTPQSIPETLVVILLDWSDPWTWIRRLREWVRLLRHVLISLDDETKIVMEDNLTEWRDRKRGMDPSSGAHKGLPARAGLGTRGSGSPCVWSAKGYADKIEKLEKDHGWHEEQFDFILQFMRTLLLKHGASLIYTTPFLANSLQSLIHSSLGIHSLLKRQSLKHNVIDRDKILVPSNWDSWGKIRIIREGFDMEGVSTAWSIEIQDPPEPLTNGADDSKPEDPSTNPMDDGTSAVTIFEQTITDPKRDTSMAHPGSQRNGNKVEVDTSDMQSFLTKQLEVLEQLKADDEKDRAAKKVPQLEMSPLDDNGRVNEHIGPVQFNMGGIQVDADDMLRKLKEREASRAQRKETITTSAGDEKAHNQALANFFAGLVKKPGASPRGSPSA